MPSWKWPLCLTGLLTEGGQAFLPFAGVEEFKPQPLLRFCSDATFLSQDGKRNLRECRHALQKGLDDGGEVELSWVMHGEPEKILSLDTEAEQGVRMRSCQPGEVELELPETHLHHAAEGHILVGSRFLHGCGHLVDRHLYQRVLGVRSQRISHPKRGQQQFVIVCLATEELPSFHHAVEFMSFNFSYMPAEAREQVPFPQLRTDFGQRPSAEERRLFDIPHVKMPNFAKIKKMMHVHSAEDEEQHTELGESDDESPFGKPSGHKSLLHFSPKQVSNFGWNWNFFMNTTDEPTINITMPGAKGRIEIHKPFIKVHAGLFLNFTSKFNGIIKVPKVNWKAGIDGHGFVQARVLTMLNTTHSAGVDPFQVFNYPSLRALEEPRWFEKIDIATGVVPLSFEPGCQITSQVYHAGTFHGAVSFGGKTHGKIKPTLSFDSLRGFDANFEGELLDTEVWPPLWMIFTKHFELGVTAVPSILMRGDFLGFSRATTAIEMMPYMNITVTREGEHPVFNDEGHTLTAYPLRVMGLPSGNFNRHYKVQVEANGMAVETAAEASWGDIEFREHVSKFDFGQVGLHDVKSYPVKVSLLAVDETTEGDPVATVLGTGAVHCHSVVDGECTPSPMVARIRSDDGTEVAAVQLLLLWHDDPKMQLASKIRGVSVELSEVAIMPGKVNESSKLAVHLVKGGLTYAAVAHNKGNTRDCATTFEFRPAFVDAWKSCARDGGDGAKCMSPTLQLYEGTKLLAEADFPQEQWASSPHGESAFSASAVPMAAANSNGTEFLAVLKVNVSVVSPAVASAFLEPRTVQQLSSVDTATLVWTKKGATEGEKHNFHMIAFKVVKPGEVTSANLPMVGDSPLAPVMASAQSLDLACQHVAVMGLPAEDAPCTFSHIFDLAGFQPGVGEQLTVMLQWAEEGGSFVMYSLPIEITSGPRRLDNLQATSQERGLEDEGVALAGQTEAPPERQSTIPATTSGPSPTTKSTVSTKQPNQAMSDRPSTESPTQVPTAQPAITSTRKTTRNPGALTEQVRNPLATPASTQLPPSTSNPTQPPASPGQSAQLPATTSSATEPPAVPTSRPLPSPVTPPARVRQPPALPGGWLTVASKATTVTSAPAQPTVPPASLPLQTAPMSQPPPASVPLSQVVQPAAPPAIQPQQPAPVGQPVPPATLATSQPAMQPQAPQVPGSVPGQAQVAPTSHPWTKDAWHKKMSEHQQSCEKRDLHFALGAGIMMRARIKNGGLLKGFPMVGGQLETPELSTGYRKIASIKPNTDARDLLPDSLCADGLCSGALPGCSAGDKEKKFYPKIVFDYNRPYHFKNMTKGKFHGIMQRAMAYAFSTMPMMINIAMKEFKETGGLFGTTTEPLFGISGGVRSSNGGSHPLPFGGVLSQETTQAPSVQVNPGDALAGWDTGLQGGTPTTAAPATDQNDAFDQWYSRRLAAAPYTEPPQGHQIAVSFPGGLHFDVDESLLQVMMRHGYFQEIEDDLSKDLGPLRITGFRLDSAVRKPWKPFRGTGRDSQPRGQYPPLQGWWCYSSTTAALLALAGLALVLATRRRHLINKEQETWLYVHPAE